MATTKQIQYRLGLAKKKLIKVNEEVTATKNRIKKFESELKKAKAAKKPKPKKKGTVFGGRTGGTGARIGYRSGGTGPRGPTRGPRTPREKNARF